MLLLVVVFSKKKSYQAAVLQFLITSGNFAPAKDLILPLYAFFHTMEYLLEILELKTSNLNISCLNLPEILPGFLF